MDKASLRLKHLNLRKNNQSSLSQSATLITQQCLTKLETFKVIGIYISKELEVDTRMIIKRLLEQNKTVCVPKIVDHTMIFIQIHDLSECALSSFDILEPISNQVYLMSIEVMLIPMLAYNASLHRLGWGLGYYDQYLKNYHGYKLGLCFKMNLEPLLIHLSMMWHVMKS
ncbi:MAG: 5-formyltetrahydrofolate cyclo-ligase, partial [Erysipelotrichaceae bacterium]